MTQENLKRQRVYTRELARDRRGTEGVDEQKLSALQECAMRAAEEYGCEAGIQAADFIASDPPGSLRVKIVVARRTRQGELLSHQSDVFLTTKEHAASVDWIVRHAAAKLAAR